MTIVGVMLAVPVSNAYEELLVGQSFSPTLSEFTASNFVLLNLPVWVTVVGIMGVIFLTIGIIRDRELGGVDF